jgi:sugar lactone lactonase YvrE
MWFRVALQYLLLIACVGALCAWLIGCGREPSSLLRQGQIPINDFPLYLTEGAGGKLWKIDRDRTKTLVAEGLTDPRGVATDRFANVYVAEYGAGRLVKVSPDGTVSTLRDGLLAPSVVAVDSFGEVYVAQDGAQNIVRGSDGEVYASFSSVPTALTFGVADQVVVGLFNENKVFWGLDAAASADVSQPINTSIDGTGRVYVAQGDPENGKVLRYHQTEPGEGTLVADGLVGPAGIAVDLVGNIFVVEQGAGRVILVTYDGLKFAWLTDVADPQYLAFAQY